VDITWFESCIAELLADAESARAAEQYGAAVAARRAAAELQKEVVRYRAYLVDKAKPFSRIDSARDMRLRAELAGAHTVARDLFRLELELRAEADEIRKADEAARKNTADTAEMTERLKAALLRLPQGVRRKLGEEVFGVIH
jgi:hypothetical protein